MRKRWLQVDSLTPQTKRTTFNLFYSGGQPSPCVVVVCIIHHIVTMFYYYNPVANLVPLGGCDAYTNFSFADPLPSSTFTSQEEEGSITLCKQTCAALVHDSRLDYSLGSKWITNWITNRIKNPISLNLPFKPIRFGYSLNPVWQSGLYTQSSMPKFSIRLVNPDTVIHFVIRP